MHAVQYEEGLTVARRIRASRYLGALHPSSRADHEQASLTSCPWFVRPQNAVQNTIAESTRSSMNLQGFRSARARKVLAATVAGGAGASSPRLDYRLVGQTVTPPTGVGGDMRYLNSIYPPVQPTAHVHTSHSPHLHQIRIILSFHAVLVRTSPCILMVSSFVILGDNRSVALSSTNRQAADTRQKK